MLVGVFSTTSASYYHRKLLPLLFSYTHVLGVLYDVRVLQPQETTPPLLFSDIRCSLRPRPITIGSDPLLFSYIRCSLRRPRPITIGSQPPFYFHILQCICCVVLQGCPHPITFYELALIIIYPFYFHNYISIMVFGYVVQYFAKSTFENFHLQNYFF